VTKKPKGDARPSKTGLFPGERIDFQDIEPASVASDEELNLRYVKGEIRIVTESARYSLAGIRNMLDEKIDGEPRYKLDPEYQRRHRWSVERKSRLIESFLMNVPVPPVFLYERDLVLRAAGWVATEPSPQFGQPPYTFPTRRRTVYRSRRA
jgi:hypothetical protein